VTCPAGGWGERQRLVVRCRRSGGPDRSARAARLILPGPGLGGRHC
jgi:hypothetical protein